MIFGEPHKITDPDEKRAKLDNLVEALYPGRNRFLRPINEVELKQTAVLSLPISEASAKIRNQGPIDDEEDYNLPVWCGTYPVQMQIQPSIPDPRNLGGVELIKPEVALKQRWNRG
jgi:hypothetical protein